MAELANGMSIAKAPAFLPRSWGPLLMALLLIGGLLLTGCSGEESSPKLDALKADPMATFELPNLVVDRVSETADGESLGKPHPAEYLRVVHITSGNRKVVLKAVKELAEENGWSTIDESDYAYAAQKKLVGDGLESHTASRFTMTFSDARSAVITLNQG